MPKDDDLKKIDLETSQPAVKQDQNTGEANQTDQPSTKDEKGIVKPMSEAKKPKKFFVTALASLLIVAAGVGTGYGLSQATASKNQVDPEARANVSDQVQVGDVFGSEDDKAFRDSAEGVLLKGGLEGEGSHRLLRPGGETQTVYLTSSVIDLDPFVNHKVKVWGETFAAQKANWLMDVGRAEVIELDAELPFEESE